MTRLRILPQLATLSVGTHFKSMEKKPVTMEIILMDLAVILHVLALFQDGIVQSSSLT